MCFRRLFPGSLTLLIALLGSVLFATPNATSAQVHNDSCDVGGRHNDVYTLDAAYDSDADTIEVVMVLCDSMANRTAYRVHFDHTPPFFDVPGTEDRNGDGKINARDRCAETLDDAMVRHRSRNRGPGIRSGTSTIEIGTTHNLDDTLTYRVPVAELNDQLTDDDVIYIWSVVRFRFRIDRAPNTDGGDGCAEPEYESEVLTVSLTKPIIEPTRADDDTATADVDTPVTIDVLANDNGTNGASIDGPEIESGPSNGAVEVHSDGTVTYTPDAGFIGTDSFVYSIESGGIFDSATVTVVVGPVKGPFAIDDEASTNTGVAVTIAVLDNDFGSDGSSVFLVGVTNPPNAGTAEANPDGTITYTPNAGFIGTDTFTYTISDEFGGQDTAEVTIRSVEPP